MARIASRVVLGTLVVWLMATTLVPTYLLLSGRYNLVRISGVDADPMDSVMSRVKRQQGVREGENGVYSWDTDGSELHPPSLQSELDKVLSLDEADPRAPFEQVVALSSSLPKITNISRIMTPSPEAFRNYIAPVGLPVIFTDMLQGELLGRWSWDYVQQRWGDTVFHNTRQGSYSTKVSAAGKHYINRVSVRLADFIDVVVGRRSPRDEAEQGLYITKQRVIPVEDLESEFNYPPFYPGPHKNCFLEPTGWIGAPGTFTQGHIDSKDNFVYQILGEKRWTIFSPVDYRNLYYKPGKGSLEWSAVLSQLGKVDLLKYPLYAKTTPVTFTMTAGEVLYLPRGWTHMVENVSPSLMINTWRYGPAHITWFWSEQSREEIKKRCF